MLFANILFSYWDATKLFIPGEAVLPADVESVVPSPSFCFQASNAVMNQFYGGNFAHQQKAHEAQDKYNIGNLAIFFNKCN